MRRSSSFNRWRIEHLIQNSTIYGKKLFLHYADLSDDSSLRRIFSKTKPDEFYHLAGQSHVGISFEVPEITTQEIANCTLKLLEICRDQDRPPRIYLACSSEIFGNSSDSAQNENSSLIPLLHMVWLKPFVCTWDIFIVSLTIYLFVMASFIIMNLLVVAKTLLPKNYSWGSIYRSRKVRLSGAWKSKNRTRLGIRSRLCPRYVVNASTGISFRLCFSDGYYP